MSFNINIRIGKFVTDQDIINLGMDDSLPLECVDETTFPDLFAKIGIFKSKSDARRNGWDGDRAIIKEGFTDMRIGKLKHRICIIKDTLDSFKE